MTMTKTLETLIERAGRKGEAVKRVRECNIMHGYSSSREFVEQWKVTFERTEGGAHGTTRHWRVYHYGTLICYVNDVEGHWALQDYYGESRSDADTLNGLCSWFGLPQRFAFRKQSFIVC